MTAAVVVAACLGIAVGWLLRSELARDQREAWRVRCASLRLQRDRHRRRAAAWSRLRGDLGDSGWLAGGLRIVADAMQPGETAWSLSVQAHVEGDPGQVVIAVDRGDRAASRAAHCLGRVEDGDDGRAWQEWVLAEISLPEPCDPAWRRPGDGEGAGVG